MTKRKDLLTQAQRETRSVGRLELRAAEDGTFEFQGYATTFGDFYTVHDWMGEYEERFAAGAFAKTLTERDDIVLLLNHDGLPLGRYPGTLELSTDETGLLVRCTLDGSDPDVMRVVPKLQRGDLRSMSIAFSAMREEWNNEETERTITEARLYDVSIVTTPANPATSAGLRAADAIRAMAELDETALVAVRSSEDLDAETIAKAEANLQALATRCEDPECEGPECEAEIVAETQEAPAEEAEVEGEEERDEEAPRDTRSTLPIEIARAELELLKLRR